MKSAIVYSTGDSIGVARRTIGGVEKFGPAEREKSGATIAKVWATIAKVWGDESVNKAP